MASLQLSGSSESSLSFSGKMPSAIPNTNKWSTEPASRESRFNTRTPPLPPRPLRSSSSWLRALRKLAWEGEGSISSNASNCVKRLSSLSAAFVSASGNPMPEVSSGSSESEGVKARKYLRIKARTSDSFPFQDSAEEIFFKSESRDFTNFKSDSAYDMLLSAHSALRLSSSSLSVLRAAYFS